MQLIATQSFGAVTMMEIMMMMMAEMIGLTMLAMMRVHPCQN
jgi:hypothetical protein